MSRIVDLQARLYRVPLDEVMSDAKHGDHTHFELVVVTVRTQDGLEGTGYTYTGGFGGRAILAMVEHDLRSFLLGQEAGDVEALHDAMQWRVHYVARGGIASFAISAVDIALWDLRGRATGQPLWRMAGGASDRSRVYRGAIDLNFPLERLKENVRGYLAEGFEAGDLTEKTSADEDGVDGDAVGARPFLDPVDTALEVGGLHGEVGAEDLAGAALPEFGHGVGFLVSRGWVR